MPFNNYLIAFLLLKANRARQHIFLFPSRKATYQLSDPLIVIILYHENANLHLFNINDVIFSIKSHHKGGQAQKIGVRENMGVASKAPVKAGKE
jgi:hypothetical protein